MNKFNRPRGNAVKQRKIKLRSTKKRSHVKEKASSLRVKVGGQRTGKSERRRQKAERAALRTAIAQGKVDLDMADLIPEAAQGPEGHAAAAEVEQ
ncbi:hypothetical protein COCSUDRAFT_66268 [Coccomyxa subellipsoidea C-169]|uniref:Uncharacterized protein n=1 Tax=Coccomyxa subellipsoidea (strain C-169) TaxID=574566 RepID=I0YVV7_COCSC|nr:hypothetical protein COCSUDRAFT_66268 [Coccomyxa subellipsoidea C-169]EIE22526.1 hypothetical protein COCSUDRAFT_66268 [Coccomyxa subellipsoidea C-169]|eukprot:XP_005647070.1 hypothetical protein COCSUDRAFT_66268 [Coccomyxa subellipsoidea C-169]